MQQLFSALVTVVLGVAAAAGYFYGANKLLDLILPPRGGSAMPSTGGLLLLTPRNG